MRLNIDSVNISGSTHHNQSHKIELVQKKLPEHVKKTNLIESDHEHSFVKNFFIKLEYQIKNIKLNPILIITPLIVISTLGVYYRYSLVNSQYSNNLAECKKILADAKNQGIAVDDLRCSDSKLTIGQYLSGFDYQDTSKNRQTVNQRLQDNKSQTSLVNNEIEKTQKQLELLAVDYNSQVQTPKYDDNLGVQLNQKQSYSGMLKKLLEKSISKIDDEVKNYTNLISQLNSTDQKQAQVFLQKYNNYNQQDKIQNFSTLKSEIEKLQKIIQTYPAKITASSNLATPADLAKYKIFTGVEFQNLYESTSYQKVGDIASQVVIIGDEAADNYIYKFAENRGYKRRAQAVESGLVAYQGQRLQSEMQRALSDLEQEALKSNIKIGLVSGYRSVSDQLSLFKSRFEDASKAQIGRTYTPQEIASGQADKALDSVLQTSSVPGYSRHHTGYTVDISDASSKNSFTLFKNTAAFKWISANNYLNAKKFGLIPSYPSGQQQAGPNPEEWEFVWVGTDQLLI